MDNEEEYQSALTIMQLESVLIYAQRYNDRKREEENTTSYIDSLVELLTNGQK
jgi:hypothetical protein